MSPYWFAGPDLWWGKLKLWFSASNDEMFWKDVSPPSPPPPCFIISLIRFSSMLHLLKSPFFRPRVFAAGIFQELQSSCVWHMGSRSWHTLHNCMLARGIQDMNMKCKKQHWVPWHREIWNCSYALVYFHTSLIAHCAVGFFCLFSGCIKIKCQAAKWAWLRGSWWAALAFAIGSLGRWYLLAEMTVNWCSR